MTFSSHADGPVARGESTHGAPDDEAPPPLRDDAFVAPTPDEDAAAPLGGANDSDDSDEADAASLEGITASPVGAAVIAPDAGPADAAAPDATPPASSANPLGDSLGAAASEPTTWPLPRDTPAVRHGLPSGAVEPASAWPVPDTALASRPAFTTPEPPGQVSPDTSHHFNRELSWLRFNERVLEEALDPSNPLLERVRFLSIFGNNLDEFFMVRVSGLRRQLLAGVVEPAPDGMSPAEQLAAIRASLEPLLDRAIGCWRTDLLPKLTDAGIRVLRYDELKKKQRKLLRRHFKAEIFPVLTPLAFDPGHPFPHISNLSLNLAIVARHPQHGERFARLKVPQAFPRLLRIPTEEKADQYERLGLAEITSPTFVWLEEVIAANLDVLFPGVEIVAVHPFRVTRDADLEIQEDEASDLLSAMSEVVEQRHFGSAVRLELDSGTPKRNRRVLMRNLQLAPYQLYQSPGPIGLSSLGQLAGIDRADLKFPPFLPVVPSAIAVEDSVFAAVRHRDQLLYHPYDSFSPVVNMLREAADDPDVLAIKQTLYRTGPDSPIVEALMRARENGKQVSVLVEIKARFDEENNMGWARALERAGVHVVYGLLGLKTHAKLCLIVRKERRGICRYVHLATGNYNPVTARIYTDLGLFTCRSDIADDVSDLFNALTGISAKVDYRKLLVAPGKMREGLLARIAREIEVHRKTGDGYLAFKVNSLTDAPCIEALYAASQAGVRVELQVRGICGLRPGVPGLSESISVTSIVGRFLEHSRIFYFRNGGHEEILLGSADLMVRNLSRRVEVLFPVEDPEQRAAVRDGILFHHLSDTAKARRLLPDGRYERARPVDGTAALDSQRALLDQAGSWRLPRS